MLQGEGAQTWETTDSDVALLVAAAERGDEDAWGEIVDRYTPLVVTVGPALPAGSPGECRTSTQNSLAAG